MNKFEALLKKGVSHIYTTKDPLLFHQPANEVPATSNYQRVSYMNSKGLFYIDTGTKVKQNTKICIAVDVEDESLDQRICGAYGPGVAIATKNGYFRVFNANNQNELTDAQVLDNINIIESYENKIKVNGREITLQNSTVASNNNIILFGANYQNSLYQVSDCRIYYCDIYEGTTLVKSLIPVYHKTTHEVGMLDTVNNIFYKAKTQLPNGYQLIEYATPTTGEPYINTGITGDQNTKAEVTFSSVETVATCIFGYQSNGVGITFNMSESANNTRFGSWSKTSWGSDMFDGNKHTVTISQSGLYQDGTLVDTPTSQTFTTGNLTLFKADGAQTYGDKKIYRCRIWNNTTLQRDLVPCKNANEVVGMYDLVNGVFYDSESESTFTAGNETLPDIGIDITNTSFVKKLPDAYQQLEYIESTGTQSINPDIMITEHISFEVTIDVATSSNGVIIGSYIPGTSNYMLYSYSNGNMSFFNGLNNPITSLTVPRNTKGTIKVNNESIINTFDNTTKSLSDSLSGEVGYSLYLFSGRPSTSSNPFFSTCKMYKCKIFDGATTVRNFIPCYKKSDGQEGLYDLISKTFYPEATNKNFTRGPVLDEYIESTN